MEPMYDVLSHLVYVASRQQVSDVWVSGRCLMSERRLTTLDEAAVRSEMQDDAKAAAKFKADSAAAGAATEAEKTN
jgi:5-methylthioadenosine/S-adenosylhomocysteine deaminase